MRHEVTFRETYAKSARAIAEWLQQRPPGLVFSIDIGGSTFDSILSNAAIFSNNEFVPASSLLRHRALMIDRAQSINASDVSAVFGKYDGQMRATEQDSYWTNGVYQTRSVGSWLEARARANVLHFGDPELLFDHIEGAASALESQRPILTLYPAGQDRSGLLSLLSDFKYTVVDLGLRPVFSGAASSPADFGWIALPDELEGSRTPESAGELQSFDGPAAWLHLDYGEALPRQRRSSTVFNIGISESPRLARMFSASEILCHNGCYPVEGDGEKFWRWLGPGSSSRIALPCSLPGSYHVEITAAGTSAAERLASCRVLVEGREARTSTNRVTEGKLEFVAHLDWVKYTGHMEVNLITFGCRPPTDSDSRTLRLCIESIAVSPCA